MITPWQRLDDGQSITHAGYRKIVHKKFLKNDGHQFAADVVDLENNHAACVIALDVNGKIIIARQFRCGPERVLDELPGGLVEPGEAPLEAIKREMLEEVGYISDQWLKLGTAYVNAWSNTVHHYFFATNCAPVESSNPDEDEEIEVDLISVSKLLDNARKSRMTDVQAVLFAYDRLKEMEENS